MDVFDYLTDILPPEELSIFEQIDQFFQEKNYTQHDFLVNNLVLVDDYTATDLLETLNDIYQYGLETCLVRSGVVLMTDHTLTIRQLFQLARGVDQLDLHPTDELAELIDDNLTDELNLATIIAATTELSEGAVDEYLAYVDPRVLTMLMDAEESLLQAEDSSLNAAYINRLKEFVKAGQSANLAVTIASGDALLPLNLGSLAPKLHRMVDYSNAQLAAQEWVGLCLLATDTLDKAILLAADIVQNQFLSNHTVATVEQIRGMGPDYDAV